MNYIKLQYNTSLNMRQYCWQKIKRTLMKSIYCTVEHEYNLPYLFIFEAWCDYIGIEVFTI